MVDIFPQIFEEIQDKLNAFAESDEGVSLLDSKSIKLSNMYLYSTQNFPCVTVEEMDNSNADGEMDLREKHASLMYEINIYDNSAKKLEVCRKIMKIIDGYMSGTIGLRRTLGEPFPNTADSTVYRYLLRYEGYIDTETGNISITLN